MKKVFWLCFVGTLAGCTQTKVKDNSVNALATFNEATWAAEFGLQDIAIQNDDKVVTVGAKAGSMEKILVTRQLPDMKSDPAFASGGFSEINVCGDASIFQNWVREYATAVVVQPDGKIVVVGHCVEKNIGVNLYQSFGFIVRLESDGNLDSSFGKGGIVVVDRFTEGCGGALGNDWTNIQTVTIDKRSGQIYIGGYGAEDATCAAPGLGVGFVARYQTNGSLDTTFGANGFAVWGFNRGINIVIDIKMNYIDDRLIVLGSLQNNYANAKERCDGKPMKCSITGIDAAYGSYILSLKPDGSIDESFNKGAQIKKLEGVQSANVNVTSNLIDEKVAVDTMAGHLPIGAEVDRISFVDKQGKLVVQEIKPTDAGSKTRPIAKILVSGYNDKRDSSELPYAIWRFKSNGDDDSPSGGAIIRMEPGVFDLDKQNRIIIASSNINTMRMVSDKMTPKKISLSRFLEKSGSFELDKSFGPSTSGKFEAGKMINTVKTVKLNGKDEPVWIGSYDFMNSFVATHDGRP